MKFEGFLLFSDPLRPDARSTVAALGRRGISVRIITGDNRFVAAHVAAHVGMAHAHVVTGTDIATLGADALARLVARTHVLPRSTQRARSVSSPRCAKQAMLRATSAM